MRRVLVLDDDRACLELLSDVLVKEGYGVQTASDPAGALHRIKAWKPHLVMLDLDRIGSGGAELIAEIRKVTEDDYVSIILIAARSGKDGLVLTLDHRADDFLAKPFNSQELVLRIRTMLRFKDAQDALRRANHRIDELTSTDELTGLMNMRSLHRRAEEEISRAHRFRKPASALLINLDRFSEINHQLGFSTGSAVIQEVGRRIHSCMRSIDLVARVGADEFFAFLVETDLANAEFMAERILDVIQSEPFRDAKTSAPLSAGIGVAWLDPGTARAAPGSPSSSHLYVAEQQAGSQLSDLFHFASEALRSAKRSGANRIEIYSFA